MLDITSISAIVAAAGVLVGVIFTVLQLRDLVKTRKTDVIMRLHSDSTRKEMVEAQLDVFNLQFKDYNDLQRKYGSLFKSPETTAILMTGMFYEGIGSLVYRGLADIDLVRDLFAVNLMWQKIKPIAEGMRKQLGPGIMEWFEYLANEVKKREQQLAKAQ